MPNVRHKCAQTPAERVRAKLKVMLDKATASGEPFRGGGGGMERPQLMVALMGIWYINMVALMGIWCINMVALMVYGKGRGHCPCIWHVVSNF